MKYASDAAAAAIPIHVYVPRIFVNRKRRNSYNSWVLFIFYK